MTVKFFDSIGAFATELNHSVDAEHKDSRAQAFNGNQTFEDAMSGLRIGRPKTVAKSDKLLQQMQGDTIELDVPSWEHAVAGFIPCVPSYLAGSPESMRRPVQTSSDRSPIRVFASVCLSAGFTAGEIQKRGIALLALCRKLQMARPVELWVFADLHGGDAEDGTGNCAIPVVKIETMPLDLATATYAMTDAGFLRQLCFAWGYQHGFDGGWAWHGRPFSDEYLNRLRDVLKINDNDLLIAGTHANDKLASDPVGFINEQVNRLTNQLLEAA